MNNELSFWKKEELRRESDLLKLNEKIETFGLEIKEEDVKELLEYRKEALKQHQRIEYGDSILSKIIDIFCDSPYIYQDNFIETMESLQDIFFLYKNEAWDEVTDEELLFFMKKEFDGKCQGSLEYLEDTSLEAFARTMRRGGIM